MVSFVFVFEKPKTEWRMTKIMDVLYEIYNQSAGWLNRLHSVEQTRDWPFL